MKTVLITGANRGIGYSFAKWYVSNGFKVICTARKPSAELDKLPLTQLTLDISSDESINEFRKSLGNQKIDLLINNAGILIRDQVDKLTRKELIEQYDVNAVSPILLTTALLGNLNPDARIVFITSSMGSIAENQSGGYYGYRASKTGLNMLVKSLSIDLKSRGFPCLALHPGYIQTDMTNMNGDMGPDEAVERMVKVIEQLDMKMTGEYRHRDGRIIPW